MKAGQKQLLRGTIAHLLPQLMHWASYREGGRVWSPQRLEQAAGPTAGQTTIHSGVLYEQNPEAKINGSGGKKMTTGASNAEG